MNTHTTFYEKTMKNMPLMVWFSLLAPLSAQASLDCEFNILNSWEDGATAEIVITNSGSEVHTITEITAELNTMFVEQSWSAQVEGSNPYTFIPFSWANQIAPNHSVTFGMQLSGKSEGVTAQLGGDCGTSANQPPVAIIEDCMTLPSAWLYAEQFVVSSPTEHCQLTAEDPEGLPVTYQVDWGDGVIDSENHHTYLENGLYTATLTVSDGKLSSTASTTVDANGSGVPGTTLMHCSIDGDKLKINCEDRGSIDPDGELGFAVFINDEVKQVSSTPLSYATQMTSADTYAITYGMTDHYHVDEQTVYAYLESSIYPVKNRGLDCTFTLGAEHDYGTEAIFTITNTSNQAITDWESQLLFSGNTQIVRHQNADLMIVDGPEYYLKKTLDRSCATESRCGGLAPGDTDTVTMVLQGEITEPALGGDCGYTTNHPPVANFGDCPIHISAAILYGESFRVNPVITSCEITAKDQDGDALSYSLDWGDGTVTTDTTIPFNAEHQYINSDKYTLTLTVSDGELTDSVTTVIDAIGMTLPPQPLTYCQVDRESLTLSCEDRGSFDVDSSDLGFIADIEGALLQESETPFSFTQQLEQAGTYDFLYGMTDGRHIVSQRMTAQLEDETRPTQEPMFCYFTRGKTHSYGTEATLYLNNSSNDIVTSWRAVLNFAEDGYSADAKVVYQENAVLRLTGEPGYTFGEESGSTIAPGETLEVKMILQEENPDKFTSPTISGDCNTNGLNQPPEVAISCEFHGDSFTYADEFISAVGGAYCRILGTDPDGDDLTYSVDWGDGSIRPEEPLRGEVQVGHTHIETNDYTITVDVSDGIHTTQASTTVKSWGSGLPGKTLAFCALEKDSRTVYCEDRGSFDPDSELFYAAFIDKSLYKTSYEPLNFSYVFDEINSLEDAPYEGSLTRDFQNHIITYGTASNSHIDEQNVYVRFEPAYRPTLLTEYDCDFSLGGTHDYGTDAELTISPVGVSVDPWYVNVNFPGNTQVVNHKGATLFVGEQGSSNFLFEDSGLKQGQASHISMIIQGDIDQPELGGVCSKQKPNHSPVACIKPPMLTPDSTNVYVLSAACSSDADEDVLTYRWQFQDGDTAEGETIRHSFAPGTHEVTLIVSDGVATDSARTTVTVTEDTNALLCDYELTSQWETGFTALVTVTNQDLEPQNPWEVTWEYTDGSSVKTVWGAQLQGTATPYLASGLAWNNTLDKGESTRFGILGAGSGRDMIFSGLCQ